MPHVGRIVRTPPLDPPHVTQVSAHIKSATKATHTSLHWLLASCAALLALMCFVVAGDEATKLAPALELPHGPASFVPYLIACAGCVLLTFAVNHAMRYSLPAGCEDTSLSVWSQWSAIERTQCIRALDHKAVWSFRTWMAATFTALAGLHIVLWQPLTRGVLSLQIEAITLISGSALIAVFGFRWFRIIHPRSVSSYPGDTLISTERWILHAQAGTPTQALFLWMLCLAAGGTVVRGLMAPRPFVLGCVLMAGLAAALLWSATSLTYECMRTRGHPLPILRMRRERANTPSFIGMLDFSSALPARQRDAAWLAELRASYWVYGRWPWKTWFAVSAPLSISRDARSASFRLVLDDLPPPPSSLLTWSIFVHCHERSGPAMHFPLPREALYLTQQPPQ
jgi:hypothetical protein